MNKSDTICPTCGGGGLWGFVSGQHMPCSYCHGTGRVPATPTIKTGEQTWYKDGHHPTPDKCSNPDHEMLLPTGNVIHSDAKHRYDTPAPDTQPDWGKHVDKGPGHTHHAGDDCDPTNTPDTYSPGIPVESETPGNPGNTQPDEPLEPQYKSETTVQAKSAGVEQYQPVFDTQPGDELKAILPPEIYKYTEVPHHLEALIAQREQAAYTQGRRDELDGIVGEIGPLIKGETWEDWAWRVKNALEARATALQEKPKDES